MQNILADTASRQFRDDLEWKLNPTIFSKIITVFPKPDVDLFASRLNRQLLPYVSWRADPASVHTDAFTLDWSTYDCFYAFPPFSIINKVLTKIEHDEAIGILIAPLWHTQSWFPTMLKLLVRNPIILPFQQDLLSLPFSNRLHPLRDRLRLMACSLSGRRSDSKVYRDQLPKLSSHHGGLAQRSATSRHSTDGFSSALGRKLIRFDQLW